MKGYHLPRKAIALSVVLFAGATVAGYLVAPWLRMAGIERSLEEAFGPLIELSPALLFFAIFLNNAIKALLVIMLGTAFGVIPLLFTVTNGVVLGFAIQLAGSASLVTAALLPHGVIEIPAVLLSAGLGFSLGATAWRKVTRRDVNMSHELLGAVKTYILIIGPALLVASAIETFVTPLVVHIVSG
ncbi:MAG: stage II sporulation protein M [Chloroflexota bacterium]